jgi:membrane fusion protein (multidrug efflux system)
VIGLKTVSTGAFLSVNTKIATIQALDPVKLEFTIPEKYRSMINDETSVRFTTESSEGVFTGKIYAFEPKIDLQTRSVVVRAICPNKDLKLYPGAFAHIEIPLKKISSAIMIPTQALIPELKGQKVYISKAGNAEKVSVETGVRNDTSIQIISGIKEGDTLLTTGLMQIRPGMPLKIKLN